MKKLTTTILGLSLLAGSALSAQDSFAFQSFYPDSNDEVSTYLTDNKGSKAFQTLAKSSISSDTFTAFFPESDNDTPEFLRSKNDGNSIVTQTLAKSSLQLCTLASFYPESDTDSPRAHISC